MGFDLSANAKYSLAKSLTEFAIQNGLIMKHENSTETAKEVTSFFDTVFTTVGKSENVD